MDFIVGEQPAAPSPIDPFAVLAKELVTGVTPEDVHALGLLAEAMAVVVTPEGNQRLNHLASAMGQMTTDGREALALALRKAAFQSISWPVASDQGGYWHSTPLPPVRPFNIPPHMLRPKPNKQD